MSAVFITATGTDIGKTFVTAGLIRELQLTGRRAEALKPVVSGFDMRNVVDSDTGVLLAALGRSITLSEVERISPWRLKAPLSPDMAAQLEGRSLNFDDLLGFSRDRIAACAGTLLIEGVGGIMAPLNEIYTVLDWMAVLNLPVLLVAGSYLGSISHTLSALDVLNRRGLKVISVVLSETPGSTVDLEQTISTIRRFAKSEIIGLPRLGAETHRHPTFERLATLI
jgi:dethiobiotin synthetase